MGSLFAGFAGGVTGRSEMLAAVEYDGGGLLETLDIAFIGEIWLCLAISAVQRLLTPYPCSSLPLNKSR
jgi:hypothetical protein